ncbi:MAG: universal stress protein [Acidobacteria bacterium]|nr:universal stress protein [Acidobacteriota bacterium]
MLELRRILVPHDFSEAAGHAARYACQLASHFGAEVTLLHVLAPLHFEFSMTEPVGYKVPQWREQRLTHARGAMAALLTELPLAGGIRYQVVEGDAAQEITGEANSGEYDAVVMSTLGAGTIRRMFLIGSVTSKVLHAAERPVITSAHFEKCAAPAAWRRMLCAVDFGPQSARVLCWAAQAARRFESELWVAHAAPPVDDEADWLHSDGWREAAMDRLKERMEFLKHSMSVDAATRIEFGHVARVISDNAREVGADVVVLGRGESQDLIGRLRANAYDVIRQCPCPVVSV